MSPNIDYRTLTPDLAKALRTLNAQIDQSGLENNLLHLIKVRASQINGCAFCIDMHVREALADGEQPLRLHLLPAWSEAGVFNPREMAAIQWTEKLCRLSHTRLEDADRRALGAQFSPEDIARLTVAVGMINLWNRVYVGLNLPPANQAQKGHSPSMHNEKGGA